MEKTYIIKNLGCAHCGSLIEEAIGKIDGVESAVLNFATRKIKVNGELGSDTLCQMNNISSEIEPGTEIVEEASSEADSEESGNMKLQITTLAAGAILFVAALIVGGVLHLETVSLVLYVLAYLLLGWDVLKMTLTNILHGRLFDENFLMTIATVGAFVLGEFSEAVGVVLFFKIGEIFEDFAVNRSRKAITAATGLRVEEADLLSDGEFVRVPSEQIKVGDVIRVKPGERVAVDGVVESGATRLDVSAINGEPVPVSVNVGEKVVSGSINISEVITVRAEAAAGDSMMAKVAEAVENAAVSKPKIDRFITRFAKVYTPIVIAVAAFTAIVPSLVTGDWSKWIYTALTFLVISCPCALVLSVPLAYFSGIGAASKQGILFKGGASLEALSNVKVIAFDKTGTITNGTFSVTDVKTYGDISEGELLTLCASCEEASTHPVAVSIIRYCNEKGVAWSSADRLSELSGRGISAVIEGKEVLCGNARLMSENGIVVEDTADKLSGSVVYVAVNGSLSGRITVSDTIKKSSATAVKALNEMGMETAMLTGDRSENASVVAEELGIKYVKGELLPDGKLNEIRNLREKYGPVMFVGDGINDGPVLAGADVGGAMQSGSDLALEAADAVFMNSEPQAVVEAKKIADRTNRIAWQNIVFALAIKGAVLLLGLLGWSSMWFAVFADSGVAMLLILNSVRILRNSGAKKSSCPL